MVLEKHFEFKRDTGCMAINIADVEAYVNNKMIHFRDFRNWTSKQEHLALFQELLTMVNEDIQNPDINDSDISHLLYYDAFDRKKFILYYDLVFILGSIAYNVFDYDKNALNHTEDGQHGPINLADMVQRGYDELVAVKRTGGKAAYGSTLIFTTVLEAELKRKFKQIIIDELTSSVEAAIQSGSFANTAEDRVLLDCLEDKNSEYNSVYVTTQGADELFTRSGVYNSHQSSEYHSLILNKMTLNQLLQSSIFQAKAQPVFTEILTLLFGTNNLNLRNDIAHGGFGYQNYYHTTGAALLYWSLNSVIFDYWRL